MQKTEFPFEIVINDDCSTDGTTEIIKEYADKYPELFVPIFHKENQYSKGNKRILATFVFPKAKGKYIALCEGDDYWTDPLKLQKQADVLESDDTIGLCYCKAISYNQKKESYGRVIGSKYSIRDEIYIRNKVPTLTVCFRSKLLKDYVVQIYPISKDWKMGDLPMWIFMWENSKVKFVNACVGVYRILNSSASHCQELEHQIEFVRSAYEIRLFFIKYYNKEYLKIKVAERFTQDIFDICITRKKFKYAYVYLKNEVDMKLIIVSGMKSVFKNLIKRIFLNNSSLIL